MNDLDFCNQQILVWQELRRGLIFKHFTSTEFRAAVTKQGARLLGTATSQAKTESSKLNAHCPPRPGSRPRGRPRKEK